jgi:hypothetical protein
VNIVVDGLVFRVGFEYEPGWEPASGQLHVERQDTRTGRRYSRERKVRGRTVCHVHVTRPDEQCRRHVIEDFGGIRRQVVADKAQLCTCHQDVDILDADSWCSLQDQFEHRVGRKRAFGRAIEELDKATRAQLWAGFLGAVSV